MKQAVLTEPKKFEINEVPVPEIGEAQVLMKVQAVGICGSDIHAYHGKHPFISTPVVPGHEATGIVEKIGSKVTAIQVGDRIVFRPQKICGECTQCRSGRYNICNHLQVYGCQDTGACSDYYAVDADLVYKLPENIDFAAGTALEPLAVGVHAVKRGTADVTGKKVLVIGGGTIGNVVAQSAKGLGADKVMITDISNFQLDIAKKCGIDYTVNVSEQDLAQEMAKHFGPDGADVIYECTASEKGLNQALEIARKGVTIVIVGVYGYQPAVTMANVQDREYVLAGTLMYLHDDYLDAIRLVEENKVNLPALVTHKFALDDIAKAYTYIEEHPGGVQKVILTI